MATNQQTPLSSTSTPAPAPAGREPKRKGKGKPAAVVGFGSAKVPVYRCASAGRVRFAISYYREGRRLRRFFPSLAAAKKEALLVARRIQQGMQRLTDLKPHDRGNYLAACARLDGTGVPLVAAVEDYVKAREISGGAPLAGMAAEYARHFGGIVRHATVPEVVAELLRSEEQDGAGTRHLGQLRSVLNRFAAAHPGPILEVTAPGIDAWLRGLKLAPSSRNSMLLYVNILFSFALERDYLPVGKPTASCQLKRIKVAGGDVEVFTPAGFRRIMHAAPPHLVPLLAVGGFAGVRMAELARLDWHAVDLRRCTIEIRAGQAKTASRRIVPVTDNLAAWLEPLPREGRVLKSGEFTKEATALARALGIGWPRNVLRHSFISYRIAQVKSADQVALEAGNSPAIIFRHYRELTTEDRAEEWFSILPKPGQWENEIYYDRRTRTVTLPEG